MHLENLFLNHGYLTAFLFGIKISAAFNMDCEIQYHYFSIQARLSLELQSVANHLNIGRYNC